MKNNQKAYQTYINWYLNIGRIEQKMNFISKEFGLSYDQYLIMKKIYEENCKEPTLLARRLGNTRPAVSRKLNALQRKAMIIKKHDDRLDQRKVSLALTDKGIDALNQMNAAYSDWFHKEILTDDTIELDEVSNQINKLLAHF